VGQLPGLRGNYRSYVPGHRSQLANSYTVQALNVHAASHYAEAERTCRQALGINRYLALDPNTQFCQRHLALNYLLLGVLFRDMGKLEEADKLDGQG
jgi:hypothetical protein